MDTDDIFENRFQSQINEFYKDCNLDCVGSVIEEFDEDPSKITGIRYVLKAMMTFINIQKKKPLNHPSVMYKKSSVLKAGGPKTLLDLMTTIG